MIPQIKLLLLLLNLFLGLGVMGFIYHRMRLYQSFYLRLILKYTILTEGILLVIFLFQYFELNIVQRDIEVYGSTFVSYTFSFIYLCMFMIITTMYEISISFQNKKLKRRQKWILYAILVFLVVFIHFTSSIIGRVQGKIWIFYFYDNLGVLFPLAELIILIRLFVRAGNKGSEGKIARIFAIFYLSRYPLVFLCILLPDPVRSFLAILILHLVPVIWIRFFVDRIETISRINLQWDYKLNKLVMAYHISKRESEILKLIMQGKNNKQIQEELFISYHTVKNHVYNIFQKLGINNRYQLINLVDEKFN